MLKSSLVQFIYQILTKHFFWQRHLIQANSFVAPPCISINFSRYPACIKSFSHKIYIKQLSKTFYQLKSKRYDYTYKFLLLLALDTFLHYVVNCKTRKLQIRRQKMIIFFVCTIDKYCLVPNTSDVWNSHGTGQFLIYKCGSNKCKSACSLVQHDSLNKIIVPL